MNILTTRYTYPPKSASNELHDKSTYTLPSSHVYISTRASLAAIVPHRQSTIVYSAPLEQARKIARSRVTIPFITMRLPASQLGAETQYVGIGSTRSSPPG